MNKDIQLLVTPRGIERYDYYQVGDRIRAKREIIFSDGSIHLKGGIYKVTESTLDYFNVMHDLYELIS